MTRLFLDRVVISIFSIYFLKDWQPVEKNNKGEDTTPPFRQLIIGIKANF